MRLISFLSLIRAYPTSQVGILYSLPAIGASG